jgi:hypothetical protein
MAATQVSEQFMQQITMIRPLPEVVMGIDNRYFRLKNWLCRSRGEPGIVRRMAASKSGGLS